MFMGNMKNFMCGVNRLLLPSCLCSNNSKAPSEATYLLWYMFHILVRIFINTLYFYDKLMPRFVFLKINHLDLFDCVLEKCFPESIDR